MMPRLLFGLWSAKAAVDGMRCGKGVFAGIARGRFGRHVSLSLSAMGARVDEIGRAKNRVDEAAGRIGSFILPALPLGAIVYATAQPLMLFRQVASDLDACV